MVNSHAIYLIIRSSSENMYLAFFLELQALLDHKKSWGKGREWADES